MANRTDPLPNSGFLFGCNRHRPSCSGLPGSVRPPNPMNIRRPLVLCVVSLGLTSLLTGAAPGAGSEPPAGFVALFNRHDLAGWKVPTDDNGHWKVLDGVIDYDA